MGTASSEQPLIAQGLLDAANRRVRRPQHTVDVFQPRVTPVFGKKLNDSGYVVGSPR
jgi:hypothetical protein